MWSPWGKSGRRRLQPNPSFCFSSFKDVQVLCEDEAPRKASLFRRIDSSPLRISTSLVRCDSLPAAGVLKAEDDASENGGTIGLERWAFHQNAPKGSEKKIVLYFTSLRVVRKTFEDCRAVRLILKGFRVPIDERDLSMDAGFLRELETILGRRLSLPRVFIGGRYMGGAEEIRQLHESGELKRYLEGLPEASDLCECCGGLRFVLCYECDGSHKCYSDKGGFRSCSICNENGLMRCPSCCS
ncbi:unnamed protein product [Victoria cruziana]